MLFFSVATAMLQDGTINVLGREVNTMHISVLMPQKISSELIGFVNAHLDECGFGREGDYYVIGSAEHFLTITIDKEPEKDLFWTYRTNGVIWFIPMSQIILDSKKTEKSHMLSYETALNLARMTQGVIYDHVAGVAYNAEGEPFERFGMGEQSAECGTGVKQLMQDDTLP
ncbi:MAG TPA: hypothetical protein ENO00_10620 [Deltaproteobacteria bacterium]|nr:hypothetical protein [Deltaproteobacteria bacterium]